MNNIQSSFKGVQALRGLAALSVMLFHFRWNLNQIQPPLGDQLFGWGDWSRPLFLISGFVITLTASRTPTGISGMISFLKKELSEFSLHTTSGYLLHFFSVEP